MDSSRFDEFTRLISLGAPRRRVVKGMLGALIGAGTVWIHRSALAGTCLGVGEECKTSEECCGTLICFDFLCAQQCDEEGAGCEEEGDCCGDLICDNGTCASAPPDNSCETDGDCEGSICCSDGKGLFCADVECCGVGDTDHCDENETCTENNVCESICQEDGDPCEVNEDCCDDLICIEAVCGAPPVVCAEEGDDCEDDGDCCTGICCAGACRDIDCCIDDEDPNARCPEGTACFEGVCDPTGEEPTPTPTPTPEEPTTLPNTGSGSDGNDVATVIRLGIAAGAAALIAGKKLRNDGSPAGE